MNSIANEVSNIISGWDALIDAAPDDGISDTKEEADVFAPAPHSVVRYVLETSGWGSKYCDEITLTGDEWHKAFESAKKIISKGGIVAMVGNRGPGKTQMAAEIARGGLWPADVDGATFVSGFRLTNTKKTALYRRAMDIFLDLRHAAKNHTQSSEKEVLKKLSDAGLLVIDEFQERGESEWENRIIKNLIDKRYASGLPTIVIANMPLKEVFDALGDSIVDRARENGRSIEFNWPSFRQPKPTA